jgi:hypothetical protein
VQIHWIWCIQVPTLLPPPPPLPRRRDPPGHTYPEFVLIVHQLTVATMGPPLVP